jgi:hypothetical protein
MKYFDPEIIKKPETQQELREAVAEVIIAQQLNYSAAAVEIGVNRGTFYLWVHRKESRGTYLNMIRVINWVMAHWPVDKEWPFKEIER